VKARSAVGLLAAGAALAGAIVFVRTKSQVEREHVDVYFADGSMVSLEAGSAEGDRLLPLARRALVLEVLVSAREMRAIVQDVADLGALDGGRLKFAAAPVDVGAMLDELRASVGEVAGKRGVTFTLDAGQSDGRYVSIETRLQSATPADDAGRASSPGYGVTTIRGQLPIVSQVALIGGVGNLFDATYNTSVIVNAAGGRYFEPAAGRTIYAGIQLVPR